MATLQIKSINCGKPNCSSCPHHFYLYAYWKENKKTKCKYIGKLGTKSMEEKVKSMGEWEQWKKIFREHKNTWGDKAYGSNEKTSKGGKKKSSYGPREESNHNYEYERQKSTNHNSQEEAKDEAIKEIERLINQYRVKLNQKDWDKISKLLNLIKNKAVQPGEKVAAITALRRIIARYERA